MKFLVVGDSMVDRYWIGEIARLNPEKHSAPLLRHRATVDRLGGAANVASNIRAMGAEAVLVGQSEGVIVKNRLYDSEDGILARFDYEEECKPAADEKILESAKDCCAVIVSDYGKGAIDDRVADKINGLCLPTFADVKVRPDRWAPWCEVMFPNLLEYEAHVDDYRWAGLVLVKCGPRGAKILQRGIQRSPTLPSKARFVTNPAGAGDTILASYVAAYMALGLTRPLDQRSDLSLRMAMDFAGAAVEQPFTEAPTFDLVYGSAWSNGNSHNSNGHVPEFARVVAEKLRQ